MSHSERPDLLLRLQSAHHAYWLWLSNRLRWRRGHYREKPASELVDLNAAQRRRIDELTARYAVHFEQRFDRNNALENYTYLDLLDQLRASFGEADWPLARAVLDVGSKNFYYAAVLQAALCPKTLTGLELEGYRIYPNLHSRHDYAMAYIRDLPDTRFVVGDVREYREPAELITCFYPFVFADTHVAWYLPLRVFDPPGQFAAMARLLKPGGQLLLCNQGEEEAEAAAQFAKQAGLRCQHRLQVSQPLTCRRLPPVLTIWQHAGQENSEESST